MEAGNGSERILVVDDEQATREFLGDFLTREGFECALAEDGNAALHQMVKFKPDIVGLSCLIAAAYKSMKETIALLKENTSEERAPRAYLIGGQVTELLCKQVGADYWTNDAMKGVRLCQQIMEMS